MTEVTTQRDEELLDTILKNDKFVRAQMPESLFKKYILPLLLAQEGTVKDLSIWVELTGSWMREISVFDDETKEELFIVPALVGTTSTAIKTHEVGSIASLIKEAERLSQTIPKAGEEKIERDVGNRIKADTRRLVENQKRWNEIYTRYGREDLITKLPGSTEKSVVDKKKSSLSDDIDGYDEI